MSDHEARKVTDGSVKLEVKRVRPGGTLEHLTIMQMAFLEANNPRSMQGRQGQ